MCHNNKADESDDEKDNQCLVPDRDLTAFEVPIDKKDRLYQCPDYVFEIYADYEDVFVNEIKSLIDRGSIYYEIFNRIENK